MLKIHLWLLEAVSLGSGHSQHSCKYRSNDLASLQDFNMENESINNDDCPRFGKMVPENRENGPTHVFVSCESISGLTVE